MLSRTFYADQSVSSLYRALVQLSATSRLQQSDAVFSSFLSWCRKAAVQPLLIECDLGKYFGADAQNGVLSAATALFWLVTAGVPGTAPS